MKGRKMKVIKTIFDYADEFNVDGIKIVTDEECEEYLKMIDHLDKLDSIKDDIEIYFGTNEFYTLYDFSKDDIKIIDIEDSEVKTFQKIFGNKLEYGMPLNIEDYANEIIRLMNSEQYKDDIILALGESCYDWDNEDEDDDNYYAELDRLGTIAFEEEITFWKKVAKKAEEKWLRGND